MKVREKYDKIIKALMCRGYFDVKLYDEIEDAIDSVDILKEHFVSVKGGTITFKIDQQYEKGSFNVVQRWLNDVPKKQAGRKNDKKENI